MKGKLGKVDEQHRPDASNVPYCSRFLYLPACKFLNRFYHNFQKSNEDIT